MPRVLLIRIDDGLRRVVDEAPDDFAGAYGASMGESRPVIREVAAQTMSLLARAPRAVERGGSLARDREQVVVIGTCGFTHGPEIGKVWLRTSRPGS